MKRPTILTLAFASLLYGCTEPIAMAADDAPSAEAIEQTKAPAPANFEQMRELVADVLGKDVAARLTPTSRYVRIQFNDVESMCEQYMRGPIEMLPEPLLGETNAGAAVSDKRPRPMYALAESGTPLPENAACEVLAEYFDPTSPLSGLTQAQTEAVMNALNPATRTTPSTNDWYPSGRIEIYDELAKVYVPISGLSVVVTGFKSGTNATVLQTETCITDREGRYSCKQQFYGFVSERVKWANSYWNIMEDNTNVAYTNSSAIDGQPWNLVIRSSSANRDMQFASAYRAANFMHNNDYRFPINTTINIRCLDEAVPANMDDRFEKSASSPGTVTLFIYCKRKTPFQIHNAVQRELGKTMHYLRLYLWGENYEEYGKVIRESWGEFTKYYFAKREYYTLNALNTIQTYVPDYQSYFGFVPARPDALNGQGWFYNTKIDANSQCRTPLFIDIADNFDQSIWPENFDLDFVKYPQDELQLSLYDYFIAMEDLMLASKNISELKAECRTAAVSDMTMLQAVDKFFTTYEELERAL